MRAEIDRDIPLPLYYQLEKIIKDAINDGELVAGDSLPTETELMEIYNISRATVRHAMQNLENEGYLRKERAKGTFIKIPPVERKFLSNLKCFSEEMQRKGIPHGTKVLGKEIINANPMVAEKLQIPVGADVLFLKRMRTVDESPVLIVESYLPYDLFPGIESVDFNTASLYDTMESRYNVQLSYGNRLIEPKLVESPETMELLGIAPGTCISAIESIIYRTDNRPVEYLYAEMLGKISINLG